MKPPKLLSGVVRGIGDLGKNVVYEAGKQGGKMVEEGVEELVGGSSHQVSSTSSSNLLPPHHSAANLWKKEKEKEEIERLRQELRQSAKRKPGRDVVKEIEEVRKKKEEEEFLKQLKEQREQEEREAKEEAAQALTEVLLPGSGQKPKRGSLFLHRKQRKAELGRGAKH